MTTTADHLARAIETRRFRVTDEAQLQADLAEAFGADGLEVTREHRLNDADRPDFFADGVAIEVKVQGSPAAIMRQLFRYAQHPTVERVLLVTPVVKLAVMVPADMAGKPVAVVLVRRGGTF